MVGMCILVIFLLTYPFLVKPAEVLVVIHEVPDSEKELVLKV